MVRVHEAAGEAEQVAVVAVAQTGDETAFGRLVERHRRELQLHCYRMVGSLEESEDLVQETFLRAWRRRETFEGRAFRAWLYRIATNACLAQRPRRMLPFDAGPAADLEGELPAASEGLWLEPYPDRLLEGSKAGGEDPADVVVAKETIELGFLAAIQHLPPHQRAVLIVRDVLGWPARDTAALLEVSVAAVKSSLQRARATLKARLPPRRVDWAPASEPSDVELAVLRRYMSAHEQDDSAALAAVLREDVRVSFTPLRLWAEGRGVHRRKPEACRAGSVQAGRDAGQHAAGDCHLRAGAWRLDVPPPGARGAAGRRWQGRRNQRLQ
jgi:RNA polymerase sigma-70 factor (ECF subfamily)